MSTHVVLNSLNWLKMATAADEEAMEVHDIEVVGRVAGGLAQGFSVGQPMIRFQGRQLVPLPRPRAASSPPKFVEELHLLQNSLKNMEKLRRL